MRRAHEIVVGESLTRLKRLAGLRFQQSQLFL